MEISSTLTNPAGEVIKVKYRDIESEQDFGGRKISGVHAYCFYNDQLVVVLAGAKGTWTPPGGRVEEGETAREAVTREVQEESNMHVLSQRFIGMQDILEPGGTITQTRSVCIVEPYGDFVRDPDDGEITEMKLIDPKDYKEYFDWGIVGDHLMERALSIREEMRTRI